MKKQLKIIWFVFLLAVAYAASNSINALFKEYIDPWITMFYRLVEGNVLLSVITICLCGYYWWLEVKKIMEDRYFSWLKLVLWLVALYVLWKGNEWGWTYASIIGSITFRCLFMVGVSCLLGCEVYKGIIRLLNSESRNKEVSHFATYIPQEHQKDEGWGGYIDSLVDNLMAADTSQVAFALGIAGEWGSGKTNFLHKLKDELNSKECIVIEISDENIGFVDDVIY